MPNRKGGGLRNILEDMSTSWRLLYTRQAFFPDSVRMRGLIGMGKISRNAGCLEREVTPLRSEHRITIKLFLATAIDAVTLLGAPFQSGVRESPARLSLLKKSNTYIEFRVEKRSTNLYKAVGLVFGLNRRYIRMDRRTLNKVEPRR